MAERYEILHPDGSKLSVEGELVEVNGKRYVLDGQGKPWLLIMPEDVVTPVLENLTQPERKSSGKARRTDGAKRSATPDRDAP